MNLKDKQTIKSSVVEIADADNGVTKEAIMVVHKIGITNYNGLDFEQPYVDKFKDTIINKPVVTKYYPWKDDLGDHEPEFDKDGNIIGLNTIAIGTIKEVWIDNLPSDEDDIEIPALYIKADLWNYKYPEIISCLQKLVEEDNADTSVEVEIYNYEEGASEEHRIPTNYTYLGNCALGSTVLPADDDAGVINIAQREIASAVQKDLNKLNNNKNSHKGVDHVAEKVEVFNKEKKINYHGKLEASSLKFNEVANQIYNLLNPVDPKNGGRDYNYCICDIYVDHVIAEDWDDDSLYSITYTIDNDQVILAPQEEWTKGSYQFVPEGVDIDSLVTNSNQQVTELNDCLNKAKEDMSKMAEDKSKEIEAKEKEIASLQTKLDEINEILADEKAGNIEYQSKIKELEENNKELMKYKDQVEKAEHDQKVAEVSAKYEKIMSKELFAKEEVKAAIDKLDTVELNNFVVEEIKAERELASKDNKDNKTEDDIVINSIQPEGMPRSKADHWAEPIE